MKIWHSITPSQNGWSNYLITGAKSQRGWRRYHLSYSTVEMRFSRNQDYAAACAHPEIAPMLAAIAAHAMGDDEKGES